MFLFRFEEEDFTISLWIETIFQIFLNKTLNRGYVTITNINWI